MFIAIFTYLCSWSDFPSTDIQSHKDICNQVLHFQMCELKYRFVHSVCSCKDYQLKKKKSYQQKKLSAEKKLSSEKKDQLKKLSTEKKKSKGKKFY